MNDDRRNSELSTDASDQQAELHAYLDGELAPDERSRFEQRLAADSQLQAELHRQQRAWDLLDALPRSDVSAKFTQTTVEMIALDAEKELATAEAKPDHRWFDLGLLTGGVLAAALGGFLLTDAIRPRPDDELLRNLPAVRDLDDLGRTEPGETAEFFRSLQAAKISFPAAEKVASQPAPPQRGTAGGRP
ncbi:MAG: hypothetical protein JNL96_23760 [Planctomycetaceae bacterium]|nr:hypothetical protein [Planctomycetaceae bacterium]